MGRIEEKMDIVEKEFMAFSDIASDTINVLLYQGHTLTDAKNLWSGPTETIYQGVERLRDQYEDLAKYEMIDGKVRMMYLIANQTRADGRMLLRKAGYTGGVYREQYDGKTLDIFPVIEFVLYWGNSRWRGSRDIRKLFAKRKLPEETWKYIDKVKLHVFEMRYLPENTRKLFQSDIRIVVDYLAEGEGYCSDRKIKHKAALIKMIKVLSGETDIEDIGEWLKEQGIREED
ncbi:MAG: Rpn family recombination-promoting nuclease/putative transposase, partial [Lachnospiraceae bacterium]|nr:Rpn family recombination-promoting nuclease/putative transposase [Lachnospiraceae bacterium]